MERMRTINTSVYIPERDVDDVDEHEDGDAHHHDDGHHWGRHGGENEELDYPLDRLMPV